ncbi:MAG: hypothetical protein IT374_12865 [Polyangiaceae bacterium]|nr:hypothetical protein [Polyangiaceae bacterium]
MRRTALLACGALACGCSLLGDGADLDGRYRTSWGPAEVRGDPGEVRIHYPRGEARCDRDGRTLTCRWASDGATGRATLVVRDDRNLEGTFSHGDAGGDGGPWLFVKQ